MSKYSVYGKAQWIRHSDNNRQLTLLYISDVVLPQHVYIYIYILSVNK